MATASTSSTSFPSSSSPLLPDLSELHPSPSTSASTTASSSFSSLPPPPYPVHLCGGHLLVWDRSAVVALRLRHRIVSECQHRPAPPARLQRRSLKPSLTQPQPLPRTPLLSLPPFPSTVKTVDAPEVQRVQAKDEGEEDGEPEAPFDGEAAVPSLDSFVLPVHLSVAQVKCLLHHHLVRLVDGESINAPACESLRLYRSRGARRRLGSAAAAPPPRAEGISTFLVYDCLGRRRADLLVVVRVRAALPHWLDRRPCRAAFQPSSPRLHSARSPLLAGGGRISGCGLSPAPPVARCFIDTLRCLLRPPPAGLHRHQRLSVRRRLPPVRRRSRRGARALGRQREEGWKDEEQGRCRRGSAAFAVASSSFHPRDGAADAGEGLQRSAEEPHHRLDGERGSRRGGGGRRDGNGHGGREGDDVE